MTPGNIKLFSEQEKKLIAESNIDLKKLYKIASDKGTSTFGGGDVVEPDEAINLDDISF